MPSAYVTAELIEEAAARRRRHEALFNAIAHLDRAVEEIWFANIGRIRVHGPGQRVLAVLFGKATKSLDAIRLLCETGFGQDAVILTRSLVNLAINLWYIGSAPDPDERALDYNASRWMAQRRFFANFPGRPTALPEPPNLAEIEERAKRWDAVTILDNTILDKTKGSDLDDTYREVYRFGSSMDHSDSWSAGAYYAGSDGETIKIDNAPNDEHLTIALGYAFQAVLIFMNVFCRAFGLDERERLDALLVDFKNLKPSRGRSTT